METPLLRLLLLTTDLSERAFYSGGNTQFEKALFKIYFFCMLGVMFQKPTAPQHLPEVPAELLQQSLQTHWLETWGDKCLLRQAVSAFF